MRNTRAKAVVVILPRARGYQLLSSLCRRCPEAKAATLCQALSISPRFIHSLSGSPPHRFTPADRRHHFILSNRHPCSDDPQNAAVVIAAVVAPLSLAKKKFCKDLFAEASSPASPTHFRPSPIERRLTSDRSCPCKAGLLELRRSS